MSRKSVLKGLGMSGLADIQEQILAIVFSRMAVFLRNSEEVKKNKGLSVNCLNMMMSTTWRDNSTKRSSIKSE